MPVEVKAEFVRRLVAAGLPIVEATSFVHPTWVPQLADAAELMTLPRRGGPRPARCWCPTSAASTGPSSSAAAHRDLRLRDRDLRAEEPQPHPRRAVRDVRADRRAAPATPGSTSAPTSRCASATRGRARCPIEQVVDGRHAGCSTSAPASSASATPSASAPPATSRALRRGLRRGRGRRRPARDALPRHLRPGARQHVRRAGVRASPRSTPAPAASAAAPTRSGPPATSPPRTWSGC